MKLLILGGTQFVGRHITEAALAAGHQVTLFNRGRTNQDLFPEVEKLVGDRDGGLEALENGRWDAVIDVNGYYPRLVGDSARLLKDRADSYVFISTISVYASLATPGQAENSPLGTLEDQSVEEINGETYGPLKVLCEQVVQETFPANALIIRPGLVTGPHDHTDRFAYWPVRVDQGGDVLAPGFPDLPIQHIDGRDLAKFTISMTEAGATGAYNATGPDYSQTLGELLETCQEVSPHQAEIHWVDEAFLLEQEVAPFTELPFWVPSINPDYAGFMRVDCSKAQAAGLTYRPLVETVRDTLAWHRTRGEHSWERTLAPEKEAALLAAWRGRDE